MTEKILKNCLNSYFIETGTHTGRAIDIALKVGFDKIISIEIEDKFYEFCKKKFKDKKNVILYHEDTLNVFRKIINPIKVILPSTRSYSIKSISASNAKKESLKPCNQKL